MGEGTTTLPREIDKNKKKCRPADIFAIALDLKETSYVSLEASSGVAAGF